MKSIFLTFFCVIFGVMYGIAQTEPAAPSGNRVTKANQDIQDLKSGALIVRLATEHRKISKLQELLAVENVSSSQKARIEEQIARTIETRDAQNFGLVAGFRNHYNFSEVYFIYDTAFHYLAQDLGAGHLLSDKLEPDPSIRVEQPVYLVRFGSSNATTTTRLEDSLIVMDEEGNDLSDPFPYYSWIFTPKRAIKYNMLNKEQQHTLHMEDLVKKLNKRFWKYYKSVM